MFGPFMRVAVTGTTGRVGAALAKHFSREHEVIPLPRAEFDFSDPVSMAARLESLDCEVFLNPGGLTSLEACEDDPEMARQLNVQAPSQLAAWASLRGVRLVHFSTDYVFSGDQPELRTESETPGPLSVYGRSKLAGEQVVLAHPGHLVLRVSWVFGPEKPSFLDSVIRDALAGKPLSAIGDKFSLPTHTGDLSEWTEALIKRQATGLFHACQLGPPVSWHGMAEVAVDELSRLGRLATVPAILATKLEETTAFRAKRPRHTAMSTAKLGQTLGELPRGWQAAVRDYVSECR
jgi:dTDP-4-dehydrorhamnose reductase